MFEPNLAPIPSPEYLAHAPADDLLRLQQKYNAELSRLKTVESLLRVAVVDRFFGKELVEGMNTYELGQGYQLKVTHSFNYTLSNSEKPRNPEQQPKATDEALKALRATGNEGTFIADRLVKWSPELSLTEWRKLSPEHKALFNKALTISDAAHKVEIKAP